MNVPAYWHTWKPISACDVISCALNHARTFPAATQIRFGWFMLRPITMHMQCLWIIALRFFHYVAIDSYVIIKQHAHSKHDDHDDDKMNTCIARHLLSPSLLCFQIYLLFLLYFYPLFLLYFHAITYYSCYIL